MNLPDTILDPHRRHDFTFFVEAIDSNPNGDPDADNMPRLDPETQQGIITDVAFKRRIRDFVALTREAESPFKIYVERGVSLAAQRERTFEAYESSPGESTESARRGWMCQNFFDVRMFGAVLSTGLDVIRAGQVRGPIQLTFARSIDPVFVQEVAIARVAREDDKAHGTFGHKYAVPYGLYRCNGFYSPHFAEQTGVTSDDLATFWTALGQMYEIDRSASKGTMTTRSISVFTHDSQLGNAPAQTLFERIRAVRTSETPPRSYNDYTIEYDNTELPTGIELNVW